MAKQVDIIALGELLIDFTEAGPVSYTHLLEQWQSYV